MIMKLSLGMGMGGGVVGAVMIAVMVVWVGVSEGQDLKQQFLDPHNQARAQVKVGALQWDDTVAAYAQSYADQRRGDCALMHSGSTQYGENIFQGSGRDYSPGDAVNAWVSEKQFYDYNSNTCAAGKVCGHYTQVVWRNSVKLGCARVTCSNGAIFITCNYSPPGNVVGQKPY